MSDLSGSRSPVPPPPPPPTKYSHRAAHALARIAQPFFSGSRPPSPQSSRVDDVRPLRSKPLPGEPQTVTHRTGIPITALDTSPDGTHAVIGGKEILKTINVSADHSSEEYNIRNAVISYASTHHQSGASTIHKDQLNVRDVKWSHSNYERMIATAVANGRIILYDLHRPGLQVCRFQGHNRQVHRLAFNPHLASWLLSGSQDGTIRMWDLRSPSMDRSLSTCGSKEVYQSNSDAIRDVRWSPSDGVMFATASDSGVIQMWDSRKTNAPVMRIAAHERPCFAIDWHADGRHVISGGTDRLVKVWDFSTGAERRQKPLFQFRTPQAVTNVRWRPPSLVGDSPSTGKWQSTQVVTTYDKEDPRIHLWDLRRVHVPFREFDRYDVPAADLLWHSKDLLWTVGESGAFTQTDVRYAPTVANRRPVCAAAWNPNGSFVAFGEARPRRRGLAPNGSEFLNLDEDLSSNGDHSLSQSPADDVLDGVVVASSFRPRQSKLATTRQSKSLGSTPPGVIDITQVLPLNQALAKIPPLPLTNQIGIIGSIPNATNTPSHFRYLARHYSSLLNENAHAQSSMELLLQLLISLDKNAECAMSLSLPRLAQTWRIVKFAIIQEFQRRAREMQSGNKGTKPRTSKDGLAISSRVGDHDRSGKMKSRLFKGVMQTEGQRNVVSDTESTSNMTTPLAQPIPDTPQESWSSSTDSQIPSLSESGIDLDPLPPSVLSPHNGWAMSESDPPSNQHALNLNRDQSLSSNDNSWSAAVIYQRLRDPLQPELDDEQRSAPRAIAGRSDWHTRLSREIPPDPNEDEYDQKLEHKRAAISNYKQHPKKVLKLDTPTGTDRGPSDGYIRRDSSESFTMFSASTDGSNPSKSIAASFSSNIAPADGRDGSYAGSFAGKAALGTRKEPYLETSPEEPEEDVAELDELDVAQEGQNHLARPSTPPTLLTESTPLDHLVFKEKQSSHSVEPLLGLPALPGIGGIYKDVSQVRLPLVPDSTESMPWSVAAILTEAIRHYHSTSNAADVQTAAHLLRTLHVLYEDCEDIFPCEESELIFRTYNEHLVRHSMEIEAAELRLSCVSAYPGVYDYALADTFINVFCFTCQRPYENPQRDNLRCHRCNTRQPPCPICQSLEPPEDWVTAYQDSESPRSSMVTTSCASSVRSSQSAATEPLPTCDAVEFKPFSARNAQLWLWCQGCGHGGHTACITLWLRDVPMSEGGCATPGCWHDCAPGPRREFNRQMLTAATKRRDSTSRSSGVATPQNEKWPSESRTLHKVRGMLGAAGVAATTGTGHGRQSSGALSPKKVRLLTPNEQDGGEGPAGRSTAPP
ncbi:hypothetical protein N7539_001486 [Penicillium diatomitis]|uniref:WD repeat protein n=1 Tax=Penicillium diatomitis TaxID=2819901 RepID=A0A9W9XHP9_9EURO|nr:uncharacterized protein N7539_001486 [Penicillium diatomitis]KAJ5492740.1 hypothetical protein N7539_001486 [Penicillium diatomitis]